MKKNESKLRAWAMTGITMFELQRLKDTAETIAQLVARLRHEKTLLECDVNDLKAENKSLRDDNIRLRLEAIKHRGFLDAVKIAIEEAAKP